MIKLADNNDPFSWLCSYCGEPAKVSRIRKGKRDAICNKCILKEEKGKLVEQEAQG